MHDGLHNSALVYSYGRDNYYHDNNIYNGNWDGFYHNSGERARYSNNRIWDIKRNVGGDAIQLSGEMDGSVIEYNWADLSRYIDLKACWTTSSDTDSGFVILRGNTCITSPDFNFGSGMYNEANILITGNYFYGGRNAIWCAHTSPGRICDVFGNVVVNPKERAIQTGGTDTLDRVFNNTLIGASTPRAIGISLGNSSVSTVQARGNIIVGFTTGVEKQLGSSSTDSHNLFFNISGNTVTASGSPVSPGAGCLTTDPLFVNGFRYG